jgi:hypothetical protein
MSAAKIIELNTALNMGMQALCRMACTRLQNR